MAKDHKQAAITKRPYLYGKEKCKKEKKNQKKRNRFPRDMSKLCHLRLAASKNFNATISRLFLTFIFLYLKL